MGLTSEGKKGGKKEQGAADAKKGRGPGIRELEYAENNYLGITRLRMAKVLGKSKSVYVCTVLYIHTYIHTYSTCSFEQTPSPTGCHASTVCNGLHTVFCLYLIRLTSCGMDVCNRRPAFHCIPRLSYPRHCHNRTCRKKIHLSAL